MVTPCPARRGFQYYSVQDHVKALMLRGFSREEAITRVESILRCKLPEGIKERIK